MLPSVTFSATKFEVTTSKGLGGDAFTGKIQYLTFDLDLPSTSCDLFSYKV